MKSSQQTYTGTDYNGTVALVVVALIFSPAVLFLSGPLGQSAIYVSIAFSGLCLVLAWANWKRRSTLSISSVVE